MLEVLRCAACGKEGGAGGPKLKSCAACKLVKYCGAACQKAHRPEHKKECRKRAAEIRDDALFRQPPPFGECPICLVPMPLGGKDELYHACCGTTVCCGCMYADKATNGTSRLNPPCPFCRTPAITSPEEEVERLKKRTEANDAEAFLNLSLLHSEGVVEEFELMLRASELGSARAQYFVGEEYCTGENVGKDMKKATHYWELAAIAGHCIARHNLGISELQANDTSRAIKHHMIGARAGYEDSLNMIRDAFRDGAVTKEEYEKTLRAYKESQDAMKSDQRNTAHARVASLTENLDLTQLM